MPEKNLQRIFNHLNNTGQAAVILDADHNLVWFSDQFQQISRQDQKDQNDVLQNFSQGYLKNPDQLNRAKLAFNEVFTPHEAAEVTDWLNESPDEPCLITKTENELKFSCVYKCETGFIILTIETSALQYDIENKYDLFENLEDSISVFDKSYNLIYFNKKFAEIVEFITGKKPVTGRSLLKDVDEEQAQIWEKRYLRALAGEVFREEVAFFTASHNDYHAEILFTPLVTDGEVRGFIQTGRQVTKYVVERKNLYHKIQELKQVIEKLEKGIYNKKNVLNETIERAEESERILSALMNVTPDWIFVKDRNYRFLLCNEGFARSVGKPVEEIIGDDDIGLGFSEEQVFGNPQKGIRGFRFDDEDVINKGIITHNPHDPANFADGSVHIFDTYKLPLRNSRGEIYGVLGISRDITERIEAEEKQAESEASIRALLENTDELIWSVDKELNYRFLNTKYKETMMSVTGSTPEIETPALKESFSKSLITVWRELYSKALGGESFSKIMPTTFINPEKIFLYNFYPIRNKQNQVIAVSVFARDITELKNQEEQLKTLNLELEHRVKQRTRELQDIFYYLPLGLVVLEKEPSQTGHYRVRNINTAALELFQKQHDSIETTQNLSGYINLFETEELNRAIEDVFAGMTYAEIERNLLNRKHQLMHFKLMIFAFQTGMVAVMIEDITETRMLEQEIIKVSDLERTSIAEQLHDDIGSQLTGITFLLRAMLNTEAASSENIRPQIERALNAVEVTIDHARSIMRGLTPMHLDNQGFVAAIEQQAEDFHKLFQVKMRLHLEPAVQIQNPEVANHVFFIIQESVHNAVRHGEANVVEVSIKQNYDKIIIKILNNGKPFEQNDLTSGGMGLRIMKHRAALIGGSIDLVNSKNGVLCHVSIPLRHEKK